MRVLGLVPARGGSKGVVRKNARPIAGKPLLAWTAAAALAATSLDRVILSTDDPEIADIGRAAGLEVPFLRPPELADDTAPMIDVILHALGWADADAGPDEGPYDALCLLQPTNPMRTAADIDAALDLLGSSGADTVFTTLELPTEHHPDWAFVPGADGDLRLATGGTQPVSRRQDLSPAVHREGSVYVVRTAVLRERGSLYGDRVRGLPIDPARSANIDTPDDWAAAEALLLAAQR